LPCRASALIKIYHSYTTQYNEILSVEDAEKQYQNALDKKEEADKQYQNALKNAVESQTRLEQLEKGY